MSTRSVVVLVCDLCGLDENDVPGIETRRVALDGIAVEGEVCERDWSELVAAFATFARKGRKVPARTRIKGKAKSWPGTVWKFSDHALMRLAERHLDPMEIIPVIENPQTTRPGNASDLEIRERGKLKAVVAPERAIVITVARRDEEDDG